MKRKLALIMVISLVLSLGAFSTVSFAADNGEITITTGKEFVEKVISDNFGSTFVIEGKEDTDGDGIEDGIILPDTYSSVADFHGTIKGIDGKNNVYISGTKSLFSSFGAGNTSVYKLILKGELIKPTGNEKHTGVLVNTITDANAIVTIDYVENYVDLNTSSYRRLGIGGIVGSIQNATVTISNCKNYGQILYGRQHTVAGGILGSASNAVSIIINNCSNHADITYEAYSGNDTPTGSFLGGIYGGAKITNSSTYTPSTVFKITSCSNSGDIYGYGSTGVISGGIVGLSVQLTISQCYNSGEITSGHQAAGGILGYHYATTYTTVTDCFNVGVIKNCNSSYEYKTIRSACGIACAEDNYIGYIIVTNCYNVGDMSQRSYVKAESTDTTFAKQISNSTNENTGNNYCIEGTYDYNTEKMIDNNTLSLVALAAALPTGFTSVEDGGVWTYTTDESYNYSLPQISGNEFVNTLNNDWYIEASEEPTLDEPESYTSYEGTVYDEENEEITDYAIVVTKFEVPESATSYTYGMLLHEANEDFNAENASAIAPASKNVGGAYGILFYGNRFAEGKTYYVRPYVEIDGTYTLGEITSFVFSAE